MEKFLAKLLKERCCDFKLLEEKCKLYIVLLPVQRIARALY